MLQLKFPAKKDRKIAKLSTRGSITDVSDATIRIKIKYPCKFKQQNYLMRSQRSVCIARTVCMPHVHTKRSTAICESCLRLATPPKRPRHVALEALVRD